MSMSIENFVFSTMLKIKNKSEWTYLHCKQVGNLAVSFGKKIGLSSKELKTLRYMGYLHDTGKLYMEQSILNSNKGITEEEYEKIKQHPRQGYNYLNKYMPEYEDRDLILAACLFHHYREDKKGYPHKSTLEDITPEFYLLHEHKLVEIVGICDAFNAIVTDRPYSKGKTIKDALDLIIYNSKTQFDEELSFMFYSFVKEDILKQDKINIEDYPYDDSKFIIDLILDQYVNDKIKIDDYKLEYIKEYDKYICNKLFNMENDISFNESKEKYILLLLEDLILDLDIESILINDSLNLGFEYEEYEDIESFIININEEDDNK